MCKFVDYDQVVQDWKATGASMDVRKGYINAVESHVSPRVAKAVHSCSLRPLSETEKGWLRQIRGEDCKILDNVETRLWVSFWGDKGPEPKEDRDSHVTHCCVDHGCKYSKTDCPVANGTKRQVYPCPYCSLDENAVW